MSDEKSTEMVKVDQTGVPKLAASEKATTGLFSFLGLKRDDYSSLSFTQQEADKIRSHLSHLVTGATAAIPLLCGGKKRCPFAQQCPFVRIDDERKKVDPDAAQITPVGKQCHPAGQIITTTNRGPVPIEELDSQYDQLLTYHQKSNFFPKRGKRFQTGMREYVGDLIHVHTEQGSYSCTSDHIAIVRWNRDAEGLFAVYLMQRGPYFRVGRTKLFLKLKGGHRHSGLAYRGRSEQAERMWLLGVYETQKEAHLAEERFSLCAQAPKACFIAPQPAEQQRRKWDGLYTWVTQSELDRHHASVRKPPCHWATFLHTCGLDIRYPVWEHQQRTMFGGLERTMEVRACNLVSQYMSVPCVVSQPQTTHHGNDKPEWFSATVTREQYSNTVYSLEVEGPWQTYVINDVVTHNCLVEVELLNKWTFFYIDEYEINEESFTEVQMVRELAEIELMLWRLNNNLAKPEHAELIQEVNVGIDKEGNALTRQEANAFIDAKERLQNRKSKLIKLMVGDRQEKYKREAALKMRADADPSTTAAQLRSQIDQIMRKTSQINLKLKEAEGKVIDGDKMALPEPEQKPLSPEDLIGAAEE